MQIVHDEQLESVAHRFSWGLRHQPGGPGNQLGCITLTWIAPLGHTRSKLGKVRASNPLRARCAKFFNAFGAQSVLGEPHEKFTQLGTKPGELSQRIRHGCRPVVGGAVFDFSAEQFGDQLIVLGASEQRDRLAGSSANDFEGERRNTADKWPLGRCAEGERELIAHGTRGGAAGGKHEYLSVTQFSTANAVGKVAA